MFGDVGLKKLHSCDLSLKIKTVLKKTQCLIVMPTRYKNTVTTILGLDKIWVLLGLPASVLHIFLYKQVKL